LSKSAEDEVNQQIIYVIETTKPENVQQLIDQIQTLTSKPTPEILDRIIQLQQQGKIHIKPQQTPVPEKFTDYLTSNHAFWYWITMALTIATTIVVFTVSETAFPLVYVRYVLGTIFIIWLPGYAFIKALFPQHLPFAKGLAHTLETSEKNIDTIETIALSIGMSLALVPITGLLLNYTPWGIRLTPIVLSLLALTTIFATAAIIREHQTTRQKP
jgi:sensor histidine kinase YesM